MTDLQDRLFDVSEYGGELTPKEKAALDRREKARPQIVVEPHRDPWVLVRNRGGVAPFFHLVKSINPEMASVTVCGLMGTTVTNTGVDSMVRCPECDAGAQINGITLF